MDLTGPMEARLLEVERRLARLDHDLRTMKRDATTLSQGAWDAWSAVRLPREQAKPATDCVGDFPDVCPCFPHQITLKDTYYGDCVLTYDPTRLAWLGCKLVSLPANPSCSAVSSFALLYTLTGNRTSTSWNLVLQYKTANFTTRCPVASTCPDATNQALNLVMNVRCH